MMGIDELYKTSDLYIAAWLLSQGLRLQDIDRHNRQRCDFIFEDRPDRPELVNQFMCGSAIGNVADFIYYLKRARRLLYSREV